MQSTHLILILYMGIAGFFWALHNSSQPYDNRSNNLTDRLEGQGLMTRFFTLLAVQVLLLAFHYGVTLRVWVCHTLRAHLLE